MLLRHSLHLKSEAEAVERAVEQAIAGGARTADLTTKDAKTTEEMGGAVIDQLKMLAKTTGSD
jgi:3-isopropylmalate dehydrogenase